MQNRRERFVDVALGVGVVDPQDELAALPFGKQPIEERGPHAADVQVAGRARSKARANGHDRRAGGQEDGTRFDGWHALTGRHAHAKQWCVTASVGM